MNNAILNTLQTLAKLLCILSLLTAFSAQADYFMLGNSNLSKNGVETFDIAPNGGSNSSYTFVFKPTQTLSYTGVEQRSPLITSSDTWFFCKTGGLRMNNQFQASLYEPVMATSLKAPDTGYDLFKTSSPGLFYSMQLLSFKVSNHPEHFTINGEGDIGKTFKNIFSLDNAGSNSFGCGWLRDTKVNKVQFAVKIRFYTNNLFNPNDQTKKLEQSSDSGFIIKNPEGGQGMIVKYRLEDITVSFPTCQAATVNGTSPGLVELGSWTREEIVKGIPPEKNFTIHMRNCIGIRNIDVKLSAPQRSRDSRLLANTLRTNAATGVGVKIMGLPTTRTLTKMQLLPGDPNSVYRAAEDETSSAHFTDGTVTPQNGTTQHDLHFTAQLVHDGSPINNGEFKATGTFTLTYP